VEVQGRNVAHRAIESVSQALARTLVDDKYFLTGADVQLIVSLYHMQARWFGLGAASGERANKVGERTDAMVVDLDEARVGRDLSCALDRRLRR